MNKYIHTGSIPGLGRSSGEGNGNPLQYSSLENSMDRGAWRATKSSPFPFPVSTGLQRVRHDGAHTHDTWLMATVWRAKRMNERKNKFILIRKCLATKWASVWQDASWTLGPLSPFSIFRYIWVWEIVNQISENFSMSALLLFKLWLLFILG